MKHMYLELVSILSEAAQAELQSGIILSCLADLL